MVVDLVWSLKAPPGTENEVVVALVGTLMVELWVIVSVPVEVRVMLSVGSQSSPGSVGVATVMVAVLEVDDVKN
jgi:hypothetical protein